ncbi:protein phosphatase CheZ [Methylobacterium sp. DB0501]|uniref:protein phosphatase CheZ n=1 Tax=Methylobacterium sp. DB0501 TaxID=2709665 RepID=UPI0013EB5CB5|nr:protein phosphatase CheZ [Methylobacterium sp. DB0501]NGM37660.1 protein phosphatase CheZ [Methylobacterium sp. DB0501]
MKNKRFRIEDSLGVSPAPIETAPPAPSANDERISEILATVNELKRLTQTTTGDVIDACRREITEVYGLRNELDVMKAAIGRTKHEIAVLHRQDFDGKGVRRAAGELDAVVDATERATTTILAAVEDIETHASVLRSSGALKDRSDVDAILERTVVLYEACNFQDLTGQRISKIVSVLKFVEDHIDRMIEAWGGIEAFRDLIGERAGVDIEDESSLLNGPKLDEDPGHVDQNDIDALFD